MTDAYLDQMQQDTHLKCKKCGMIVHMRSNICAGLRVGDVMYTDPNNPNTGKCPRCQRLKTLIVQQLPDFSVQEKPQGFWKTPDSGSSSGTKTGG